jgi:putative endonuclease
LRVSEVKTKHFYVYILSNPNGMSYTGVTNDLMSRLAEHRGKAVPGNTQKFGISRLIYFEEAERIEDALAREKEIKGWRRAKKLALVKQLNPKFEDLCEGWFD